MKSLSVLSPAKINLFLEVLCKRADSYHDIKTIITPIDLKDTIHLSINHESRIILTTDSPHVPAGKSNLAYRAAKLFYKKIGVKKPGIDIYIEKRIPIAAGLGGGSSNAASTLLGLNKLYKKPLDAYQLFRIAETIGCDVPFFLQRKTAVCIGKGTEIVPLPVSVQFWCVLITPKADNSFRIYDLSHQGVGKTQVIYNGLNLGLTKDIRDISMLSYALESKNIKDIGATLYNRLEKVAYERAPLLKRIKRDCMLLGAEGALLSGSGPTVYCIAQTRDKALHIKKSLEKKYTDAFNIFVVKAGL